MWVSWWGSWAIHLNSCKIFKNRDRMMVSKKRLEFVNDDVIGHIVTRTSSDRQKIENAWPNTNIARKADPRMVLNCQSFCCGFLPFCIFVLGSHLILERNMSFLCLPVVLKSRDASFKGYFDKIFWSNSNMQN